MRKPEERKERKKISETTGNFPKLISDTKSQIQKAQRSSSRINPK